MFSYTPGFFPPPPPPLDPVVTTYEDVHSGEKLTFVDSRPVSVAADADNLVTDEKKRKRSRTRDDTPQLSHLAVVAVDFGTTYSGYAYSLSADPEAGVHVMRKWEGDAPGVSDQKTPTILLLDPERRFHSFGFTARDFYHDLREEEARRWFLFERFKMVLHHDKVQ